MAADFFRIMPLQRWSSSWPFPPGLHFETGITGMALIVVTSVWGLAFSAIGFAVAMKTGNRRQPQSIWALFVPFMLLTTAFAPLEALSGWLRVAAPLNPMTFVLDGMRSLSMRGWEAATLAEALAAVVLFRAHLRARSPRPAVAAAIGAPGLERCRGYRPTLASAPLGLQSQASGREQRGGEDVARTIVVGAGMAGLSAAARLAEAGEEALVLEARDRVGGRAVTSYDLAAHPVELGAEFIHGPDVATWDLVRRYDLATLDYSNPPARWAWRDGEMLSHETFWPSPNGRLAWRMYDHVRAWCASGRPDCSVAEAARDWEGFFDAPPTAADLALWNNVIAELTAADLDDLGVYGLDRPRPAGGGLQQHFRLRDGYSRLVAALAADLDIRMSVAVREVAWEPGGVRLPTTAGAFEAERAIITLPLGVLQAGDVSFRPRLPEAKAQAVAGLGAGHVDKIILRFDEPFWPPGVNFLFTTLESQLWWRPGFGRDDEAPVLTALIGGRAARRLEGLGEERAVAEGVAHLERMFGLPLAGRVRQARFVSWGTDPYARMGYSFVPPGAAALRAGLAKPLAGTLFFAGEATNVLHPATVHGAIESGYRAADEVLGRVARAQV